MGKYVTREEYNNLLQQLRDVVQVNLNMLKIIDRLTVAVEEFYGEYRETVDGQAE